MCRVKLFHQICSLRKLFFRLHHISTSENYQTISHLCRKHISHLFAKQTINYTIECGHKEDANAPISTPDHGPRGKKPGKHQLY